MLLFILRIVLFLLGVILLLPSVMVLLFLLFIRIDRIVDERRGRKGWTTWFAVAFLLIAAPQALLSPIQRMLHKKEDWPPSKRWWFLAFAILGICVLFTGWVL